MASTRAELAASRRANQFLDSVHPVYRANKKRWETNEARLAGGDDVLPELAPFVWETDPKGNIQNRRDQAIYINFPEIYASAIVGHLLRFAPKPGANLDFGGLGEVNKNRRTMTRADMIYSNPDGPGNTGSTWDLWWADELKMAIATGHRWICIESPSEEPTNQAEEMFGLRPYLVGYSPLDVPNWKFNEYGDLDFAIVRFWEYNPNQRFNNYVNWENFQGYSYLLLVAAGYEGLGPRFAEGGWWKFTPDKVEYDNGTFDQYFGRIPMFPLYYERSKGTRKIPAISRPGITELGQAAVAAMNISSAANFNAIEAGSSLTWMLGVDEDAQELALGQINRGDRFIGLPPNQDTDQTPSVQSSGQQAASDTTFDSREKAIWAAAIQLGISEATSNIPTSSSGPGNTGAAQQAKFGSTQAPRIVRVAANLENAQKITLDFLHWGFGIDKPTGDVQWPKKFDLVELVDRIKQYFEVQRLAGISSETLDSQAMLQVAEDKGLVNSPEDKAKILAELKASAKDKAEAARAKLAAGTSSQMQAPQSQSTRDKQKKRMAGRTQDKKKAGVNTGGLK